MEAENDPIDPLQPDAPCPAGASRLDASLDRLRVHDRACLLHDSWDDQCEFLAAYFQAGLARGERCFYLAHEHSPGQVTDALEAAGIACAPQAASGALQVIAAPGRYRPKGMNVQDQIVAFLQTETAEAQRLGFRGLRAAVEMTWVLDSAEEMNETRILECEARADWFVSGNECLLVSQYDLRRFSPAVLRGVMAASTFVIHDGGLFKSARAIPPEKLATMTAAERDAQTLPSALGFHAETADLAVPPTHAGAPLLQGRARLSQLLLDSLPCVAMLQKQKTREILASNAMACGYGAKPGKTCYETWHKRSGPCPWCQAPDMWTSNRSRRMEIHCDDLVWDAYWLPLGNDMFVHFAFDVTEEKRTERVLAETNRQLQTLYVVSDVAQSDRTLRDALDFMAREISASTGFPYVSIESLDVAHQEMLVEAACTVDDEATPPPERTPCRATPSGRAATTGHSILVHAGDSNAVFLDAMRLQTLVCQPLQAGQFVVGTLSLGHPQRLEVPDEQRLFFASLAREVAQFMHRRHIADSLAESERRFRELLKGVPLLVVILDVEGRVSFCNDFLLQLTGWEAGDVLGHNWFESFVPPSNREAARAQFAEALSAGGGIPTRQENEIVTRRGGCRLIVWHNTALHNLEGRLAGMASLGEDVTELRRIEQALHTSQERFRSILESSPDMIFVLDKDLRYQVANDNAARYLGVDAHDMAGKRMEEFLPAELVKREHADMHEVLRTGRLHVSEARFFPGGDKGFWFETRMLPVHDPGKQVVGVLCIVRDITDRKNAQDALQAWSAELEDRVRERTDQLTTANEQLQQEIHERQQFEELLRARNSEMQALLDALPDTVFRCARDGTFLDSRARNGADLLHPPADFIGRRMADVLPRDVADICSRAIESAFATGEMQMAEYQVALGGRIEDYEARIVPCGPAEFLAIVRKITDRKQAELALRASRDELREVNAELARAARMKDEFLASMSHELRTPLTGILNVADALGDGIYGELNERQTKAVQILEQSGQHLLGLINDILDLSKIESGLFELRIDRCDAAELCQASLHLVRGIAARKRIDVGCSIDPPSFTIAADARRLKQMLVNLLSNAIKFTPEGGRIGLAARADEEGEAVHFTVWDEGAGIKPEDLARLFTPFTQLDGGLSRVHSGTGLGLALVQRMADLHGGSVAVESTAGKGSRFTVSLPWPGGEHPAAADAVQPGEPALPDTAPRAARFAPRVLLVDDNETNALLYEDYLRSRGYGVIPARSGEEALRLIEETPPDIVLMDVQMPGMDGLEAIRRVRAHANPRVARVPVIALTALAMTGDRERCEAAGANDYISKPVSLRALAARIETVLEGQSHA